MSRRWNTQRIRNTRRAKDGDQRELRHSAPYGPALRTVYTRRGEFHEPSIPIRPCSIRVSSVARKTFLFGEQMRTEREDQLKAMLGPSLSLQLWGRPNDFWKHAFLDSECSSTDAMAPSVSSPGQIFVDRSTHGEYPRPMTTRTMFGMKRD